MNKMLMVGTGVSGLGHIPILGCKRLNNISQIIKALFAKDEQGFAYDFNDFSTMFQDAAGNVPVTAAGQPVGLVLDKSKGLKHGAELFTKFNSTLNATLSSVNTPCVVTSTVNIGVYGAVANVNFMPGVYKIDFAWEGNVINREMFVTMPDGNNLSLGFATAGTYSKVIRFNSQGSMAIMQSPSAVGQTFTIKQLSIKLVLGNHAFQTVAASRPILRQTPILGNETVLNGDFSGGMSNWVAAGNAACSVTNGEIKVLNTTGGLTEQATQSIFSRVVKGATYAYSVTLRETNNASRFLIETPVASLVNLSMATARKYTGTFTVPIDAADLSVRFRASTSIGSYGVFDDVTIKEITGYYTDRNYMVFDGVDDCLQASTIDFSATDKISLFVGVQKLSDAARGFLLNTGSNGPAPDQRGNFSIEAPSFQLTGYSATLPAQGGNWDGLAVNVAPHSAVLSARLFQSAATRQDGIKFRVNGVTAPTSGGSVNTLSGNFSNLPLFIGRRGGTGLPFNGHIYSLIGISRLTTNSETIAIEKAIAKATGVTLNV